MREVLEKILALVNPKLKLKTARGWMVIDLRREVIRLPNGVEIPKDKILSIDPEKKVIIYLDENNQIREVKFA